MNEKHIQILGIFLTTFYAVFIMWLYWVKPKSLEEVPTKAQTTIENVTTKTQVAVGTYEIDRVKFNEGLRALQQNNFIVARDNFERADTERRDAKTQFYIAYSFYRQGFGKLSNDDELFRKGLEQVKLVIALDKNFKSDDANLQLKTPVELKNELEEGLRVTADDFNPFKVLRERK
jgi:TRAP-type mannitol/chloroaromatic compound transport system permease large subunit